MKKNIAILMGGYSSEYEISLQSGNVVYRHLNQEAYNLFRIHIFRDKWVYVNDNDEEFPVDRHDFSISPKGEKINFDGVFIAIHGSPGEDGYIQAYLDLLNIPHTSCDFYQAALTFNKRDCLSVLRAYGIPCATSYYLNEGDIIRANEITDKVGLPCFVKANKAGSSFGISKVSREEDLLPAIEHAFKEDDEIIIESFLDGTEVSVGVIQYKGEVTVLPLTEIVSENDFFDYNAKYLGQSQEITPARLSEDMTAKVSDMAKKVYETLKLKGFSRSEYIIVNDVPHLLEVNTIPGFTAESILPQQARKAGISLEELFNNAIEALRL
ncbi:D-alanine--D-alanine ligase [Sinomicrobium weinanense]|uniref:D-alanine--D-alanine ligase n=1 Tax=Sinomicrobium weinanense TaxID=2842200 RepID=A0A926JRS2_9FLAO|nr:D-alanine--D-alanine ligase [Sinomicrobium weinanense]MBC9796305.1 D-alanine--D-alanine ligase [Sinomicrobium weinanense]MBU3123214.1 D-alanine--D-alanine ligase [Sinomicrobium weinanense]